jgi:RNA polymerase sigma-70 factor (ECF subfamily)
MTVSRPLQQSLGDAACCADTELVAAMLRGDQRAFRTFFDSYFPRLYRFAFGRLRNVEAARDVAQSTLINAMRALPGFRRQAALFTWLCQICTTQIVDFIRANRRHATHLALEVDPARKVVERVAAAVEHRPDHACCNVELSRLIESVLDALPGRYGDVLGWKYVDDLTVEQIGERLGTGQMAAQSMLARARIAFRDSLKALLGADALDALLTAVEGGGGEDCAAHRLLQP